MPCPQWLAIVNIPGKIFSIPLNQFISKGEIVIEDLQTHLKSHFIDNPYVKLASPDTVLRRLSRLSDPVQTCMTKRGIATHQYCTNPTLKRLNIDILERIGVLKADILTVDYDNTIIFNEK